MRNGITGIYGSDVEIIPIHDIYKVLVSIYVISECQSLNLLL
jgi:hypothetical protein